jgi:hypothetical protein
VISPCLLLDFELCGGKSLLWTKLFPQIQISKP